MTHLAARSVEKAIAQKNRGRLLFRLCTGIDLGQTVDWRTDGMEFLSPACQIPLERFISRELKVYDYIKRTEGATLEDAVTLRQPFSTTNQLDCMSW